MNAATAPMMKLSMFPLPNCLSSHPADQLYNHLPLESSFFFPAGPNMVNGKSQSKMFICGMTMSKLRNPKDSSLASSHEDRCQCKRYTVRDLPERRTNRQKPYPFGSCSLIDRDCYLIRTGIHEH